MYSSHVCCNKFFKFNFILAFLRFTFHVDRIAFRLVNGYENFGDKLLSNSKRESSEIFAARSVDVGAGTPFCSVTIGRLVRLLNPKMSHNQWLRHMRMSFTAHL